MALNAPEANDIGGLTAVAVDRDRNSPNAVRWTIRHLLPPNPPLVLIHVTSQNSSNKVQGVSDCSMEENDGSTQANIFSSYRIFCARKGVAIKEVIIEDTDVSKAILHYVSTNSVLNLILGAATKSSFSRKFRNHDVPTIINKYSPDTCSVYVIGKGKLLSVRPALTCPLVSAIPVSKRTSRPEFAGSSRRRDLIRECDNDAPFSPSNLISNVSKHLNYVLSFNKLSTERNASSLDCSAEKENIKAKHDVEMDDIPPETIASGKAKHNVDVEKDGSLAETMASGKANNHSVDFEKDGSLSETIASGKAKHNVDVEKDVCPPKTIIKNKSHKELGAEIKRLMVELKKSKKKMNLACEAAVAANKKAKELDMWQKENAFMFEQAKLSEEVALVVAEGEKTKAKTAAEYAEMAQKLADLEMQRRKFAEMRAMREKKEKNRALDVLSNNDVRCRIYTLEEIDVATGSFAESSIIGEGGYGPVYKGIIDHTAVAVKVLRPDAKQGRRQFQQEVEILSCMRHPNLVLLVGACPEYGCLVYEFMDYGSLEDRLFHKDNSPTIPWKTRFKIAADIATALLFLHQAKPKPLVHRDLKPANILLDRNFVSKIGDVGLARLVPPKVANEVTQLYMTSAAGTFCYIDPEYQQTGKLGTMSDLYSLGVTLLQIVTGRPPTGLTHHVEEAVEKGEMEELLDPSVVDWPVDEAIAFTRLSLKCAELRRKDRPDLATVVLPELTRLSNLEI